MLNISAQSGSAKTASFLITVINITLAYSELIGAGDHMQPECIIVTPISELIMQIYNEVRKYSHRSAYEDTGLRYWANRIINGCHILIGTPRRLIDFLHLDMCNYVYGF